MKIVAKDFYRVFNERTKPVFRELGFKRSKANAQGWQRSHDVSQVLFWPQLDKWGWNEETGSRVAFNFSISAKLLLLRLSLAVAARLFNLVGAVSVTSFR